MKIIISPTKTMYESYDAYSYQSLPVFLNKSEVILNQLKKYSIDELKKLWKCNDALCQKNYERIQHMKLTEMVYPAIFMYHGLQFQTMGAHVFLDEELDYVNKHLYILSGFYGVLRAFDGIVPYRLEMQSKISINGKKDLYEFYQDDVKALIKQENLIINLASAEYSKLIENNLDEHTQMIHCVFASIIDDKVIVKGTQAKMARGAMVRFMASHQIEEVSEIKQFNELGYQFHSELSNESEYVFIK